MKNKIMLTTFFILYFFSLHAQNNLDVDGDAILRNNQPQLSFFDTTDNRTESIIQSRGNNLQIRAHWGDIEFRTGVNGIALPRMRVLSNGNVGIGTTIPATLLQVNGESTLNGKTVIDTDAGNPLEVRSSSMDSWIGFYNTNGYTGYSGIFSGDDDLDFGTGAGNTTGKTHLVTQATPRLTADGSGNIGIGTTSPDVKLHVTGGGDGEPSGGGYAQFGSSSGTNLAIDNNEIMVRNGATGLGADLFLQYDDGNLLLCGQENGQVGIGITSSTFLPVGYLLAVDGKIISEEVRVELSGDWPDYVFEEDYKLRSIEALEKSIQEHGHLPGIPSAEEVKNEGLMVGDMQKRMLEKIEELSLYIIQQNKDIRALQMQLNGLTK